MATVLAEHPARRAEIEKWIDENSVQWEFIFDVPVSRIDFTKSLHNQARIHTVLNPITLETYVEAMKRGDQFPAVVAYKSGSRYVLIDGNHRAEAAKQAGIPLALYVVAPDTDSNVILRMTFEANSRHGLPNSMEERARHAVYLIQNAGATHDAAAAALNLSKSAVGRAWSTHRSDQRALELGVRPDRWQALSNSTKTRLVHVKTDEGFVALTNLVYTAQLSVTELDTAMVTINKSSSGTGQVEIVKQLADYYASRVQRSAGGAFKVKKIKGPKANLLLAFQNAGALKGKTDTLQNTLTDLERSNYLAKCQELAIFFAELAEQIKEAPQAAGS